MDNKTTLEDIRKWARKVRNDRNWHPDARSLAISIVLEAGEILEHFQSDESLKVEAKYPVDGLKKGGETFYMAQKKKYREGRK